MKNAYAGDHSPTPGPRPSAYTPSPLRLHRRLRAVHAARADADVLPAVAELGHHAVRRGARRERLQAGVRRDVLRPVDHGDPVGRLARPVRQVRSASTSTRTSTRIWIDNAYGTASAHALPIFPYPMLLVGWLVNNQAFQVILILLMSLWFFAWVGTLFLSSTRVIFAAAFDRILPDGAAQVSEKRRVPGVVAGADAAAGRRARPRCTPTTPPSTPTRWTRRWSSRSPTCSPRSPW